ncbi:MAG: hypothetical protein H6737_12630 [Alphaproteobacteria bacterium]|nr:hypothetical protein [Alphaproteobacteria bacterium]
MRWEYEPKIHCELWFFSGINFAGQKTVVKIHPYGGLQGDVNPADVKSVGVIAEPGVRVVFMTSATGSDWEKLPWRCVQVIEGRTNKLQDGRTAVQIPDLDVYSEPDAPRADPELELGFLEVETFAQGKGWTFGKTGRTKLKQGIKSIRVERIPGGPLDKRSEEDAAPAPTPAAAPAEAAPAAPAAADAPAATDAPAAAAPAPADAPAPAAEPQRELVVTNPDATPEVPGPEVSAASAAQHITVRQQPPTTVSKNQRLPKPSGLSPGSGRKD